MSTKLDERKTPMEELADAILPLLPTHGVHPGRASYIAICVGKVARAVAEDVYAERQPHIRRAERPPFDPPGNEFSKTEHQFEMGDMAATSPTDTGAGEGVRLTVQLEGRAMYLSDRGEVKSPGLLREAARAIADLESERDAARTSLGFGMDPYFVKHPDKLEWDARPPLSTTGRGSDE